MRESAAWRPRPSDAKATALKRELFSLCSGSMKTALHRSCGPRNPGDVTVMKLLLEHGADPKVATTNGDTALMVAAGIGWVDGVTFEWSEAENLEAVKMCLDLGIDPNIADGDGRTALH